MANLLVVDDDKDVASPLIQFLELLGHRVRYAADGEDGIRVINAGAFPDLILLDIDMPRLSGPEMAYRLFIQDCGRENIPIVLVSAIADIGEVAALVGTPYIVPKPFTLDLVEKVTEKALMERIAPRPMKPLEKAV